MKQRLPWRKLVLVALGLSLGCTETGVPRLDLQLNRGADVLPLEHLVVFLKVGEGDRYTVGADVVDVVQAGYPSEAPSITMGLSTNTGVGGSMTVYVAACREPPVCDANPVKVPRCDCAGFHAYGVGAVTVTGYTLLPIQMTAIRADQCDGDGDLFPDCGQNGVTSVCCAHLGPADRQRIHDCHDRPAGGRGDPRDAHPFRPPEIPWATAPEGPAAALHAAYCEDGLDNDCRAELDVACVAADQDQDGSPAGIDCDDRDPTRAPGLPEICADGIDQDCDGTDASCDRDGDGYDADSDCDDSNPARNPGVVEICGNGIDDDCQGGDLLCIPEDLDGDGYPCPGQGPRDQHKCRGPGLDCDDRNAGANPGQEEICGNGIDDDCVDGDAECPGNDLDGDSYLSDRLGGEDCDDTERAINPGAAEICGNAVDEDCNGVSETCDQIEDADNDGRADRGECESARRRMDAYPGAPEQCNGLDDDCDGLVDEGNPEAGGLDAVNNCGAPCANGLQCECGQSVLICGVPAGERLPSVYCLAPEPGTIAETCNGIDEDCDGILDNNLQAPLLSLQQGVCAGAFQTCDGAMGWRDDPMEVPGYEAEERSCDNQDNDCNGTIDALHNDANAPLSKSCGSDEGLCREGVERCIGGRYGECEGGIGSARERCNGEDDDCDGEVDNGLTAPPADRVDGVCQGQTQRCQRGEWREPDYGDIDDYERNEGSCDGRDNDCDGEVDEDLEAREGALGGEGVCRGQVQVCDGQNGWQEPDYARDDRYQQIEDRCDDLDNDCDGSVDENTNVACEIPGVACAAFRICDDGSLGPCEVVENDERREICNGEDDDCDGQADEDPESLCAGEAACRMGQCVCEETGRQVCEEAQECVEDLGCVCPGAERPCSGNENCRENGCFCGRAGRICGEYEACGMMGCRCLPAGRVCGRGEECTDEGCEDD